MRRYKRLPWVPSDKQWHHFLGHARDPLRCSRMPGAVPAIPLRVTEFGSKWTPSSMATCTERRSSRISPGRPGRRAAPGSPSSCRSMGGDWVHANAEKYDLDRNRIFLLGMSAGGHMASLAATRLRTIGATATATSCWVAAEMSRSREERVVIRFSAAVATTAPTAGPAIRAIARFMVHPRAIRSVPVARCGIAVSTRCHPQSGRPSLLLS